MRDKNKYTLLESIQTDDQTDPRQQLTIGNWIWMKVLLEVLGGFGNGFVSRLAPVMVGVLFGIGALLFGGWIPGALIGIAVGLGIILGILYGRDQYLNSKNINEEELRLIIKNRDLQTLSKQTDELLECNNDDYFALDEHRYSNELSEYIIARRSAEALNRNLKTRVKDLECKYRHLTGNSILVFNETLPHPAACLIQPANTNSAVSKQQELDVDNSRWAKTKSVFAGLKQGVNYVGIPAGLILATISSFILPGALPLAATITLLSVAGVLSVAAGGLAIYYNLRYEQPQANKMVQLKQNNKDLKAKCNIQNHKLHDQLNYIHFQNKQLENRIKQLDREIHTAKRQNVENKENKENIKISNCARNTHFNRSSCSKNLHKKSKAHKFRHDANQPKRSYSLA